MILQDVNMPFWIVFQKLKHKVKYNVIKEFIIGFIFKSFKSYNTNPRNYIQYKLYFTNAESE